MKKKVTLITLQLFLLFSTIANAKFFTGSCGDNACYILDTETRMLEISGTGKMTDYDDNFNSAPWYAYHDIIKNVIVHGVTSIGSYAFRNCIDLTSITIPSSVTSIGNCAFSGCSSLTFIDIPSSVKSIGNSAFSGCSSLTFIDIPSSVKSIGSYAFYQCSSLTSITIPTSVTSIGNDAFYNCYISKSNFKNESSVDISKTQIKICDEETDDGLLILDNVLVKARSNITSANIPSSVTSIGNSAFSGCSSLTFIDIPSSVKSIGSYAFASCYISKSNFKNESSVDISKTHITICDEETGDGLLILNNVLVKARSNTTTANIPSSVTQINYSSFSDCRNLTAVTIPNSITRIPEKTFQYCNKLTSITISSSVTDIGYSAFSECSSLASVIIPSSVKSIGNGAFSGCSSLTSIDIPSSVKSIGSYAFSGCSSLTSITIPTSVTSIGNDAFGGCYILKSNLKNESSVDVSGITICDQETDEGLLILDNELVKVRYNNITTATIPSSVTNIGDGAFEGCTGLTSITIPSSVTNIGDGAFEGCTGLTSITIPSSVTNIGNGAFYFCTGLTSIAIPSSVTNIGNDAFKGCSGFTSLCIPSSVTNIGDQAFYACHSIESITVISSRPAKISDSTFDSDTYKRITLYVPAGSENTYYAAPGWINFANILTYDPSKSTYTLKIKHGYLGDTEHDILSGEKFSLRINMDNVRKVSFNGKEVTTEVMNGKYITPTITGNSEITIDYNNMPTSDDIDGDGSFTISDITELIKHYLQQE